ncbi:MAG: hypothetical protein R3C49_24015 [Planctomycetaceae bacterium]
MPLFGIFFAPLPCDFWSAYSGRPFVHCLECDVPLLESSAYIVQKRIVAGETVFEMAVCNGCREEMVKQYSEETRQNISNFIRQQVQESLRREEGGLTLSDLLEVREIEDPEEGAQLLKECLEQCVVCGKPRSACHRYSLSGLCRSDEIIAQVSPFARTPMLICETCGQGMASLISQQTRDSWDRFMEKHFGGPPGIEVDSPAGYPMGF